MYHPEQYSILFTQDTVLSLFLKLLSFTHEVNNQVITSKI
jgi:hypothetical protein